MRKITVHVDRPYEILIEKGLLAKIGILAKQVVQAKKIVLISDSNVSPLYGAQALENLERCGFQVFPYVYPAGESSKKTATVIDMVEFMAEKGLTRSDAVVALGGGVCGDMAGFAAAVYLRGIDLIQIPTSLLAQIDSSVGGKTGVNLPQGKNLCGAFHQPRLVLIDPLVLNTLSDHSFSDGMGEAVKYGCIRSESLFRRIEQEDAKDFIEELIYECVAIKREIVEHDEKEAGERALLNFGHTCGHAIEKLHHFEGISHGEAVGIGMVLISEAGERLGMTPQGTADRIKKALSRYQLKTEDPHSLSEIVSAMSADKKRTGGGINLIMLNRLGDAFIYPVPNERLHEVLGV